MAKSVILKDVNGDFIFPTTSVENVMGSLSYIDADNVETVSISIDSTALPHRELPA